MAHVAHLPKDYSKSPENTEHLRSLNRAKKGNGNIFNRYLHRARSRLHEVDVDLGYLAEIWDKQQGRCALSSIPLVHASETNDINVMASLDRIDSSKGYVRGNVQFVSCAINYAKNNGPDDSIRRLIAMLVEIHSLPVE